MRLSSLVFAVFILTCTGQAQAQLQLPGATAASPAGKLLGLPSTSTKPKAPAPLAAKGEDSLPGRTLAYMGQAGRLFFIRNGNAFSMQLQAVGRKGNDIRNACTHNFSASGPLPLISVGRPNGLPRYEVTLGNCIIAYEFLADSAIGFMPNGACTMGDDCVVDLSGLWGASADDLPKEADIEKARASVEHRLNAARKTMQDRFKHSPDIKPFLTEQVSFPANREQQCRGYTSDRGPGYCALKLTEARATKLEAMVAGRGK